MSNSKISALSSATVPLAGTEVLPIVQSSATVKATIANVLNYGKINLNAIAAPTPAFTGTTLQVTQADGVQNYIAGYAFGAATNRFVGVRASGTNAAKSAITSGGALAFFGGSGYGATAYANAVTGYMNVRASETWTDTAWGTELLFVYTANGATTVSTGMLVNSAGVTASLGNFIPGTAAKGVNFTANTPAAGMTSQLLNWYEEGTWTPSLLFGGGNTGMTYTVQSGNYVRMGKLVYVVTRILLSAVGSSTGTATVAGLPFTSGATGTNYGSGGSVFSANMAGAAIGTQFGLQGAVSSTSVSLIQGNAVLGWSSMSQGNFTNTSEFDFNFTYICA